jgi:hypothetical protein
VRGGSPALGEVGGFRGSSAAAADRGWAADGRMRFAEAPGERGRPWVAAAGEPGGVGGGGSGR